MERIMKVAVIGASGRGGSRIVDELAGRGHQVTAIARDPEKIRAQANVTAVAGDLFDAGFARLLAGHDAVVSAVHFSASDPRKLIEAVRTSGAKRYLVMGGAGSLEVAPGVRLIDTPEFPAMYKDEAAKGAAFLDLLRGESALDWTFLSPPALIDAGTRTGKFRVGKDQLLVDAAGKSHISFEDFAVALVDEIERPQHSRQRFTVGY
jgi:putative NADH-flavin reductase